MEIHATIHGAHQHRLRTEPGIVKRKLPFGVAFCIRNGLHATLQLDQNDFHASRRLAGCAVIHHAVYRACFRNPERCKNHSSKRKSSEPALHGVLRSADAGRAPRGRFTCDCVT